MKLREFIDSLEISGTQDYLIILTIFGLSIHLIYKAMSFRLSKKNS